MSATAELRRNFGCYASEAYLPLGDLTIAFGGATEGAAWGVIGAAIGTAIFPGAGTIAVATMGTVAGAFANILYDSLIAPSFDDFYTFN